MFFKFPKAGFWGMAGLLTVMVTLNSCHTKQEADLLVYGGKIYLVNEGFDLAEAMVISNGKVVATGTMSDMEGRYSAKEKLNVNGGTVYPGFMDAHCHFTGFATDMWKCHLEGLGSFDEVLEVVSRYSRTSPTEWVYGRGWDQHLWKDQKTPDKHKLDSMFPDRPVFLKRIDGHAAVANQAALQRAGIDENSVFDHGTVEKRDGKLTGLLIDEAMEAVDALIPGISDSLALAYFEEAQRLCFAVGLTGVQDCGISENTFHLLQQMEVAGKLKMHVFALLSDSAHYYDRWISSGVYRSPQLVMGGFKWYGDGALGSRGACLLEDYSDQHGWRGTLLTDTGYMKEMVMKLAASPFQLCTHAIGDSGNRVILNLYGEVLDKGNDRRWRIEHAQVVNPEDVPLFKQYKIIPSVQPTHATSDMRWAVDRLGEDRMVGAYAYRNLLQQNGWLPLGTDFPVEDLSPLKTFYAAVFRKNSSGNPKEGFYAGQSLTREEALRGMTIWAARAAFLEDERGSLDIGKRADFVVLDKDIIAAEEQEVLGARVIFTYVGGRKVFEKAVR